MTKNEQPLDAVFSIAKSLRSIARSERAIVRAGKERDALFQHEYARVLRFVQEMGLPLIKKERK